MTYGYGPRERPAPDGDGEPSRRRRRAEPDEPTGYPPRRVPQPPPPARHLTPPAPPHSAPPARPSAPPGRHSGPPLQGPPPISPMPASPGARPSPAPRPGYGPPAATPPRRGAPPPPPPPRPASAPPGGRRAAPPRVAPPAKAVTAPPVAPPRRDAPPRRAAPARPATPRRPRSPRSFSDQLPDLLRQVPHHKPWLIAIGALGIVIMLGVCMLGSYFIVSDEQKAATAPPTLSPTPPKRSIDNRSVDPTPMAIKDVFPATKVQADANFPPYTLTGPAQLAKDCRVGATLDLGKLLQSLGCNQVVRATLKSPDGQYLITAGVFNLKDDVAAQQAYEEISQLVNGDKGRFTGYISGAGTQALGRAPTQLAWQAVGHFLAYCVIARSNAKEFVANDPNPRIIIYDILETYLTDHVLAEWAIDKSALTSASASAAPS